MAAKALKQCKFSERKSQYIANVLDPILEDMVKSVLTEMPANPVEYMIAHLRRKAGLPVRTATLVEHASPSSTQAEGTVMTATSSSSRGAVLQLATAEEPPVAAARSSSSQDEVSQLAAAEEPAAAAASSSSQHDVPQLATAREPAVVATSSSNQNAWRQLAAAEEAATAVTNSSSQAEVPQRAAAEESIAAATRSSSRKQAVVTANGQSSDEQGDGRSSEESESSEDEDVEDLACVPSPMRRGGRPGRHSVSAEAYGAWNQQEAFVPPSYAKSEDQKQRLRASLNNSFHSFLFRSLDDQAYDIVLSAFKEVSFDPGATIITEGDAGDSLFVIESGHPVCKKLIKGNFKVVKECEPGDVFGVSALLYNAPRAASVDATDRCVCWQLDRGTFNNIVKDASVQKTEQYDSFLRKVTFFFNLDCYERAKLLDTLKLEAYKQDDFIVRQGDQGDKFYIVEDGHLVALQEIEGKPSSHVKEYGVGDYFGELALLRNQPRAASIKVASASARVLSLDRQTFNLILGPLEELLRRRHDK